ncbi:uncharacterized protein Z518_02520 [Rhinocladiella mackenziei CBS 650.93]|uniref:Amidase domain-containing protein n=1 Tax=Rhinocladiella mackenziei CBS 650.93 TaxID=1442369 RepID=A0A0D2IWV7_9EURO|nr:uncharacterized protein Z518_02520 [Rhinocladiella mackenziei CBS 650.93]KIX07866.1 hypothetical protein Z518_02520 [Rhinocladiella mackenziei CBS 650.93]
MSNHAYAWNKPQSRQGPAIPYKNEAGSNPVLRGLALAAVSTVIASSTHIQSVFWKLNGFDKLKEIEGLDKYEPRHDPTVVPIPAQSEIPASLADLRPPPPRASPTNYYTCADFHEIYKSGKLTPTDVVEYLLPLIRRDIQPAGLYSVAFIDSKVHIIRAAAKASTERYQAGKPLSVLDGVPLAVKDEVDLTGYKRTLGSQLDFTDEEDRTAWCVQKWQEAGAVIIGKTNMHEIGLDASNNNVTWGTPLNPHNNGYYTGGSSGGSAFVVAAGICPIALGVDGGGSIRLPAAFCGIYGLKTTHGRVSARVGHEWTDSVVVNGPMASSIDDLALGYRIMAQPDSLSRRSSKFPNPLVKEPSISAKVQGKKYLGIDRDWMNRSDPVVLDMFNAAVDHYVKTQGYDVVDIQIPLLPEAQKAHALTILSEMRSKVTKAKISKLSWHNQLLLNVAGGHATAQDFLFSQKLRNLLMCHLAWLWEEYPGLLVISPTTPCAGWKIGKPSDITSGYGVSDGDMTLKTMEYVYLANFVGTPAISCPMGYTEENVPVGLMAMGEWGSEEQLIAFGKDGESLLAGKGGVRRPKADKMWIDVLAETKAGQ